MAIESKMVRGPIGARPPTEPKKPSSWGWIVGAILAAVLVGAAWYFFTSSDTQTQPIASGEYQAVFLDNGQVYFGKLDSANDNFFVLTDVFYLQAGSASMDQIGNISLTKLGNEAHGPEDQMRINVQHILFIEDMKADSKVVEAIKSYQQSKTNP